MPITLTDADGAIVTANELGTLIISGVFKDDALATVTPNAAPAPFWTLTNASGTVINSRSEEALPVTSSYTIVLTGDDLAIDAAPTAGQTLSQRRLLVAWSYDSDAGNDLSGTEEIRFRVAHLAGIAQGAG